jgi:hypothetical protein
LRSLSVGYHPRLLRLSLSEAIKRARLMHDCMPECTTVKLKKISTLAVTLSFVNRPTLESGFPA